MSKPALRLVQLGRQPIFQQLCIEEALLYKTNENWCVYNEGVEAATPTVVLGISGKPEKMCNVHLVERDKVPLIRRFSGGGTVVVDDNTTFITLIMNQASAPSCPPYPRDIMEWTRQVYGPMFSHLINDNSVSFNVRENDYVFGDLKFAGNAQAITKGRWLHHTSFLWDYSPKVMAYLSIPEKQPAYRENRDHTQFLAPLSKYIPRRADILPALQGALGRTFDVQVAPPSAIEELLDRQGGQEAWMKACRTKEVDVNGRPRNL